MRRRFYTLAGAAYGKSGLSSAPNKADTRSSKIRSPATDRLGRGADVRQNIFERRLCVDSGQSWATATQKKISFDPVAFSPPELSALLRFYPTHFLAFWNMCSHAPFSCHSCGYQEFCTARNTRSGCGIMMLKRPSAVVNPVRLTGSASPPIFTPPTTSFHTGCLTHRAAAVPFAD